MNFYLGFFFSFFFFLFPFTVSLVVSIRRKMVEWFVNRKDSAVLFLVAIEVFVREIHRIDVQFL